MKKLAIAAALIVAMGATLAGAAHGKTQTPAPEAWEPIGPTWSVLPSSFGRITIGGTLYLVARIRQDGSDSPEAGGEFYASLQEVYCRTSRASMALTKGGAEPEVLHFTMRANTPVSTLARRMCDKAAGGAK